MADMKDKDLAGNTNPDPLTGAPGSHPVGVGVGTAGGAAAGAAVGAVGGPVGSAVGAVVGGVAGGLAGKGAAEAVNPTAEDAYWRSNYATRPYVTPGSTYDTYRPAYQYGWESYAQYEGRRFDEVEPELARDWDASRNRLSWDRAREATRDAWDRLDGGATEEEEEE
ncbi:MAG: hypothetical protein DMF80_03235 [Acidobacteria bacterium]|nr:MAG: hypothetical protein DMF80_03235 [Acidobacteriota bacterium]